ncbi:MAG: 2,3-diphosphoglycerate-dependent phosphoglycerate mutase [Maricaulaceae bacterium]
MAVLAVVRHGQSVWNQQNRFTGWVDVDLTAEGEAEARRAGALLAATGDRFDIAYASVLKRAVRTLWIALTEMDRVWLPVIKDWRLNERHYGGLTGLNKAETAERFGAEQVHIWRRSYATPPPPMDRDDPAHARFDARYANAPADALPDTESLATTLARTVPYFDAEIAPRLKAGQNVIVSAHGNSLRALVKHLYDVDEAAITELEIPTGNPLRIELSSDLKPCGARYLDAERAQTLPPEP